MYRLFKLFVTSLSVFVGTLFILSYIVNIYEVARTEPLIIEKPKVNTAPTVIEVAKRKLQLHQTLALVDYTNKKFHMTKKSLYGNSSIDRMKTYGQIRPQKIQPMYHSGGKVLDYTEMRKMVKYVMGRMPNIKSNDGFIDLVLETFMAETHFGAFSYDKAVKVGDIGLGQIRLDSANDLMKWLSYKDVVDPSVKKAILSFKNKKLSMRDNLLTNVQFTIAVTTQIYWRAVGNINDLDLSNVVSRGMLWKSAYNSRRGKGTVKNYVDRVKHFHTKYNTGIMVASN